MIYPIMSRHRPEGHGRRRRLRHHRELQQQRLQTRHGRQRPGTDMESNQNGLTYEKD